MADVKITVRPNGPYRVEAPEGSLDLVDANGNKFDLTGKTAFSLCRCGGSGNQRFFDRNHSRLCFHGAGLGGQKAEGGGMLLAFPPLLRKWTRSPRSGRADRPLTS